jgi:membrane protease YdiL (CAAX protease family)
VLFTASHGDVGSAAPILVLGLLLALVRWRTGSIWPGMALHMANNLLAAAVIIATLLHP